MRRSSTALITRWLAKTRGSTANVTGLLVHASVRDEQATAESLHIRRALLRPDHPDRSYPLMTPANIRQAQCDHAGAEPLLRQALRIRRGVMPPDDARVVRVAMAPDLRRQIAGFAAAACERLGDAEKATAWRANAGG